MGTSKRKGAPGSARHETGIPESDETEADAPSAEGGDPERSSGNPLDIRQLDRTRLVERIEPDEVNGWARQLGVSPERLREAIRVAGDSVEDVRRYLTRLH